MQVDYIIIGQGIAGSLLSIELMKQGGKVLVIDDNSAYSSSKVAGGIINPVTGKRLVKSWMTEDLLPVARDVYNNLSEEWNIPLIKECSILDFFYTQEMKETFANKSGSEKEYLHMLGNEEEWNTYFRFNYGIGAIEPCLLLDIRALLSGCRKVLETNGALYGVHFSLDDCTISNDKVVYKDITAKKIIFCDGATGADNPYFTRLPWSKDKGEALIVSIPGLPRNYIYKQGISIVPWENDLFWVGAAHDWKFTDLEPTTAFRKRTEEQLDYWLKIPYKIMDHFSAQRPANVERKPFVGLHPVHTSVGILNGMGGKGCSVAPYFARQLAQYLLHQSPITPDADVKRFERILSR